MWGLLPEIVLTNRLSGLQAPDWYEKLERQRGELAREIAEFTSGVLAHWCARSFDNLISLGEESARKHRSSRVRGLARTNPHKTHRLAQPA